MRQIDIIVINPQIPVDALKRKKSIFDIRAKFNDGEQAIIEMQINNEYNFKQRSQFIISRAYTSQEIAGLNYAALKKCYFIGITNFVLLADNVDLFNDYRFRDKTGRDLTDDETIIYMELPKVDKVLDKPAEEMTNLEMWAVFFRYVTDKSKQDLLDTIINRKEGIKMAVNVLDALSKNEEEKIQYENELIYDLDVRSGIYEAELKGREKGKIEGKLEGKLEGKIEDTLNIIKELQTTVSKAIEITKLPDYAKTQLILELNKYNIPYSL